jgi:hypothetical protein
MMKVGLGCKVGQKNHVILRFTCNGMDDMQSQEFLGMADTSLEFL